MNRSFRIKFILLIIFMLPVAANSYSQSSYAGNPEAIINDTEEEVIVFDFVPGQKMLYAQLHTADNLAKLRKFSKTIRDNMDDIRQGNLLIKVNGYCTSLPTVKENLRAARLRSNQVKSWFITHVELKEEHFLTYNSAASWRGRGDLVAVAYLELVKKEEYSVPVVVTDNRVEKVDTTRNVDRSTPVYNDNQSVQATNEFSEKKSFLPRFAIKTNLIYWAGIMPDFKHYTFVPNTEIEWYITNRWSLAATGAYAKWEVGDNHFFALSSWSLEPRFWFRPNGKFNGFYLGAYAQAGDFDRQGYDKEEFGNTGNFYGGGLSLGAAIPLGNHWAVEIGLRGGLQYAETDVYSYENSGYYYDFTRTGTKWGIHGIKCSVVYRFGNRQK